MKRIAIYLVTMLLSVSATWAVPAKPGTTRVQQPDGSYITIRLVGDEYLNFMTTSDGYTLVRNGAGFLVYAELEDGRLRPTTQRAHDAEQRDQQELAFLTGRPKRLTPDMAPETAAERAREMERRQQTLAARHANQTASSGSRKAARYDYSNFRGLVILVEYNDRSFSREDYAEVIDSMINQTNYKGYYSYDQNGQEHFEEHTGSVRDYFYDNSMGQFDPQFDVVGPIKVDRSQYYPQQATYSTQLFTAAIQAADSLVDYSQYDADGDGQIDMVFFIVAGGGSHIQTNDDRLLWPHAGQFYSTRHYDGKRLGRYACSVELAGYDTANNLDGIGVICHEFTHVLGLMDLYDTDYTGSGGESNTPGVWSLMASGGYLNDSRTPCGYTFYERYAAGFALPETIELTGSYTLESLSESNKGYKLPTKQNREYFLIENRQRTKWNQYLPGHGMMVYRVDSTNNTAWVTNTVNSNPSHNYFVLLRATAAAGATAYDPFPGARGVTEINNYTTANLKTWRGYESDLIIKNIKEEEDGLITFDVADNPTYETIEDFEVCDTLSQDEQGYTTVSGRYCEWQLIGTELVEATENYGNGQHAIAFTQNTALRSSEIQRQVNQLLMTVYNPSSNPVRIQAYKAVNGGRWTELNGMNGNASNGVAGQSTGVLMFDVDWSDASAFQFIRRSAGSPVYLDDLIFDFDNGDQSAIHDVNAPATASSQPQFFDLSGRRVNESQLKGGVYIMKEGGKARKIMINY